MSLIGCAPPEPQLELRLDNQPIEQVFSFADYCKEKCHRRKPFRAKKAKNGSPYFVLKAGNGQVIGTNEMYSIEAARDNGIASVMKNAPEAEIIDETV
ncbi:MAG: YegP family protein [Bacteroidaceae bacterium]|nr:YegP family protein [Bacteroidaceae bacterium]